MPLATREIELVLIARDRASATLARVGGALSILGAGLTGLGGIAVREFGEMTHEAAQFRQQAALAYTQVDNVAGATLKSIEESSLRTFRTVAVDLQEIQGSYYDLFSTIDVSNMKDADQIVKAFAQSAVAGQAPMKDIGRTTIAWLNALNQPATIENVNKLLNIQFELVRKGAGEYDEIAANVGKAIPAFTAAEQSVESFSGVFAFLTRNGLNAAQASTSAARAIELLFSKKGIDGLKKYGIAVSDSEGKTRKMSEVIKDMLFLFRNTDGSLRSIEQRKDVFHDIFGQGRIQARRFFDVAVPNFEEFVSLVELMEQTGDIDQTASFKLLLADPADAETGLGGTFTAYEEAIDYLAPKFAEANADINELGGSMVFLKGRGFDVAESTKALADSLDSLYSPRVQDNIKALGINTKDLTGENSSLLQLLQRLSPQFEDLGGGEQLQLLTEIFGNLSKEAQEFLFLALNDMESFQETMKKTGRDAMSLEQSIEFMAEQPLSKIQLLKNEIQALRIEIGQRLFGVLSDQILPIVQELTSVWYNLSEAEKDYIVQTGLLISVLAVLAGSIITVMGVLILLAGVLFYFPLQVGIVVLAISSLVKAFSTLTPKIAQNWGAISERAEEAWSATLAEFEKGKYNVTDIWSSFFIDVLAILGYETEKIKSRLTDSYTEWFAPITGAGERVWRSSFDSWKSLLQRYIPELGTEEFDEWKENILSKVRELGVEFSDEIYTFGPAIAAAMAFALGGPITKIISAGVFIAEFQTVKDHVQSWLNKNFEFSLQDKDLIKIQTDWLDEFTFEWQKKWYTDIHPAIINLLDSIEAWWEEDGGNKIFEKVSQIQSIGLDVLDEFVTLLFNILTAVTGFLLGFVDIDTRKIKSIEDFKDEDWEELLDRVTDPIIHLLTLIRGVITTLSGALSFDEDKMKLGSTDIDDALSKIGPVVVSTIFSIIRAVIAGIIAVFSTEVGDSQSKFLDAMASELERQMAMTLNMIPGIDIDVPPKPPSEATTSADRFDVATGYTPPPEQPPLYTPEGLASQEGLGIIGALIGGTALVGMGTKKGRQFIGQKGGGALLAGGVGALAGEILADDPGTGAQAGSGTYILYQILKAVKTISPTGPVGSQTTGPAPVTTAPTIIADEIDDATRGGWQKFLNRITGASVPEPEIPPASTMPAGVPDRITDALDSIRSGEITNAQNQFQTDITDFYKALRESGSSIDEALSKTEQHFRLLETGINTTVDNVVAELDPMYAHQKRQYEQFVDEFFPQGTQQALSPPSAIAMPAETPPDPRPQVRSYADEAADLANAMNQQERALEDWKFVRQIRDMGLSVEDATNQLNVSAAGLPFDDPRRAEAATRITQADYDLGPYTFPDMTPGYQATSRPLLSAEPLISGYSDEFLNIQQELADLRVFRERLTTIDPSRVSPEQRVTSTGPGGRDIWTEPAVRAEIDARIRRLEATATLLRGSQPAEQAYSEAERVLEITKNINATYGESVDNLNRASDALWGAEQRFPAGQMQLFDTPAPTQTVFDAIDVAEDIQAPGQMSIFDIIGEGRTQPQISGLTLEDIIPGLRGGQLPEIFGGPPLTTPTAPTGGLRRFRPLLGGLGVGADIAAFGAYVYQSTKEEVASLEEQGLTIEDVDTVLEAETLKNRILSGAIQDMTRDTIDFFAFDIPQFLGVLDSEHTGRETIFGGLGNVIDSFMSSLSESPAGDLFGPTLDIGGIINRFLFGADEAQPETVNLDEIDLERVSDRSGSTGLFASDVAVSIAPYLNTEGFYQQWQNIQQDIIDTELSVSVNTKVYTDYTGAYQEAQRARLQYATESKRSGFRPSGSSSSLTAAEERATEILESRVAPALEEIVQSVYRPVPSFGGGSASELEQGWEVIRKSFDEDVEEFDQHLTAYSGGRGRPSDAFVPEDVEPSSSIPSELFRQIEMTEDYINRLIANPQLDSIVPLEHPMEAYSQPTPESFIAGLKGKLSKSMMAGVSGGGGMGTFSAGGITKDIKDMDREIQPAVHDLSQDITEAFSDIYYGAMDPTDALEIDLPNKWEKIAEDLDDIWEGIGEDFEAQFDATVEAGVDITPEVELTVEEATVSELPNEYYSSAWLEEIWDTGNEAIITEFDPEFPSEVNARAKIVQDVIDKHVSQLPNEYFTQSWLDELWNPSGIVTETNPDVNAEINARAKIVQDVIDKHVSQLPNEYFTQSWLDELWNPSGIITSTAQLVSAKIDVRARITQRVIDKHVSQLPAEYFSQAWLDILWNPSGIVTQANKSITGSISIRARITQQVIDKHVSQLPGQYFTQSWLDELWNPSGIVTQINKSVDGSINVRTKIVQSVISTHVNSLPDKYFTQRWLGELWDTSGIVTSTSRSINGSISAKIRVTQSIISTSVSKLPDKYYSSSWLDELWDTSGIVTSTSRTIHGTINVATRVSTPTNGRTGTPTQNPGGGTQTRTPTPDITKSTAYKKATAAARATPYGVAKSAIRKYSKIAGGAFVVKIDANIGSYFSRSFSGQVRSMSEQFYKAGQPIYKQVQNWIIGLRKQYPIPKAFSGAHVMQEGIARVHRGETIVPSMAPAKVSRQYQNRDNVRPNDYGTLEYDQLMRPQQTIINIEKIESKADPNEIGQEIAFELRTL